ncbi:tail fiber domain-containing protein [Rahnella inusitata]|uniref:tail fiber domain-containing protein n=1 Tax=Rahnella inusitata TaxID=58169 RepID=UPI0039BDC2DE
MSAGTIALTNNSATVSGTGTVFTTDLKANDFIVVIVGGVTYTLGVKATASATSLTLITPYGGPTATGNAWTAVPNATLVGITAQVAADVAKAIRGLNLDKANWQQVFSGTGTITVTLPDGSTYSGPAWNSLTTLLNNKAAKGANSDITSISGLTTALTIEQGGTGAKTAAAARAALGAFSTAGGAVSGSITAGAAAGIAVAAGENNRVEINNVTSGVGAGNPVGWTVYRWYTELAQTGIRRAGDTTIQSYFVALSGGGGWEFLRGGNATASGTWTSGSDIRHKFDIEKVKNALASVLTFNGSIYGKKDGGREVGLIAQDVERACKEAITYNGDRKFSDGTVIPNFKYLNTAGAAAAYHTEAIKTLFELVELALDKPDDARALIASIKEQSEVIKNTPIENEDPRKEAPPIFDVPSSEDYEEPTT